MKCRDYVFVLSVPLLTSCASYGPAYSEMKKDVQQVPNDKARIFVLRTNEHSLYMGRSAPIKIDNEEVSSCPKGAFVYFDIQIKKQEISTETWDYPGACSFYIAPEFGQRYYFEVMPRDDSYGPAVVGGSLGGGFLGSIVGSTLLGTIESTGKQCGGMFALSPLKEEDAIEKLMHLNSAK